MYERIPLIFAMIFLILGCLFIAFSTGVITIASGALCFAFSMENIWEYYIRRRPKR